jgi:glycosyltransferase involved in cell wall biosynthesis
VPNVSVILPTFNRIRIRANYADWELIIADDGSDEETRAYLSSVSSPKVRVSWLALEKHDRRSRSAVHRVRNSLAYPQGRLDLRVPSEI